MSFRANVQPAYVVLSSTTRVSNDCAAPLGGPAVLDAMRATKAVALDARANVFGTEDMDAIVQRLGPALAELGVERLALILPAQAWRLLGSMVEGSAKPLAERGLTLRAFPDSELAAVPGFLAGGGAPAMDAMRGAMDSMQKGLGALRAGRFEEARAAFVEALPTLKAHRRNDYAPACLHNLGRALVQLGRHAEALPHAEEALAIRRATVGGAHPDTCEDLLLVGQARAGAGDRDGGLAAMEEALGIVLAGPGESHPYTKQIRAQIAKIRAAPSAPLGGVASSIAAVARALGGGGPYMDAALDALPKPLAHPCVTARVRPGQPTVAWYGVSTTWPAEGPGERFLALYGPARADVERLTSTMRERTGQGRALLEVIVGPSAMDGPPALEVWSFGPKPLQEDTERWLPAFGAEPDEVRAGAALLGWALVPQLVTSAIGGRVEKEWPPRFMAAGLMQPGDDAVDALLSGKLHAPSVRERVLALHAGCERLQGQPGAVVHVPMKRRMNTFALEYSGIANADIRRIAGEWMDAVHAQVIERTCAAAPRDRAAVFRAVVEPRGVVELQMEWLA